VSLVLLAGACRTPALAPVGPPRVVSLHDVTTEIVVALGGTERLVGINELVDATDEVTRAVAGVPRVDGLESILAVRPQVVLGLSVVVERSPELVAALRAAGVEVLLGDPQNLEDVFGLATLVSQAIGDPPAGERLAASLRARAEALPPPLAPRPVRVFVYDCCDPPFTPGRTAILTDLIARAGGENVFRDAAGDWLHVSWEEVLARRPEIVIIHAYRFDGQGDVAAKRRALARAGGLSALPFTVLPLGASLGGVRSVETIQRLRAAFGDRS
jgi:iron complex transport system substrate-binding protein